MVHGENKMEEQIQKITSVTSTLEDRIEAYQFLLGTFQEDDVSSSFQANAGRVVSVMKKDISNENTSLSQESLHFLGVFLSRENVVSNVDNSKLKEVIDELCTLVTSCKEKVVSSRSLWCLARQKIPQSIVTEKLDKILETLEYTSKNASQYSSSTELESLRVINKLVNDIPEEMAMRTTKWSKRLFASSVHTNVKVRETALNVLGNSLSILQKQHTDLVTMLVPELKDVLVPGMLRLFKEKQEVQSLKLWNFILSVFDKTLHQGASLINSLLAVVEKAFKSLSPEVKIAAFQSWEKLISNFGSELEVIANPKRLRLVMQPLKANNARTDQVARAKFGVWWHLVVTLKAKLSSNIEMVLHPFLQFCFGLGENNAGSVQSSPQDKSSTASTSLNSSMINRQTFPVIIRLGSEALAHMLGHGLELPVSKPPLSITVLAHPVFLPAGSFLRHAGIFISSVKEVVLNLGTEKKDLHMQIYLWHSLIAHIRMNADSENRKDVSDTVKAFLEVLGDFVKSDIISADIVLKFIEACSTLPHKILTNSSFNMGNSSVMKGTPALYLMKLLLEPSLLKLNSSRQDRFMTVFQKLVTIGLNVNSSTYLAFTESLFVTLDGCAGEVGQSDSLFQMWSIVVSLLLVNVEKNQEVNQGDALEHEFGCMYSTLMFPVRHLFNKPLLLQNSVKTMLKTWNDLYKLFTRCASLVQNVESNMSCEEFFNKVMDLLTEDMLQDSLVLVNLTHLLCGLVPVLDFSATALQNISNYILNTSPAKWMKKKQKPLGNFTSLVNVIELLSLSVHNHKVKSDNSSEIVQKKTNIFVASCNLSEVVKSLFSHMSTPSLVGLVVSKLARSLSLFFHDPSKLNFSKTQQRQLNEKTDAMWSAVTTCIQQHYGGPYDSDLLEAMSPLFEVTFSHSKTSIKRRTRSLWHSMFASSIDTLVIPESLKKVLKQTKGTLVPGVVANDEAVNSLPLSQPDSQEEEVLQTTPVKISGSFLNRSTPESAAKIMPKSPKDATTVKTPDASSKKRHKIDDDDEEEFVKIAPTPKRRRALTEHQMEVMSTRRSVPSLYADLSQSASQIPSQFIEDSESSTLKESSVQGKEEEIIEASASMEVTKKLVDSIVAADQTEPKRNESQENVAVIEETQEFVPDLPPCSEVTECVVEESVPDASVEIEAVCEEVTETVVEPAAPLSPEIEQSEKVIEMIKDLNELSSPKYNDSESGDKEESELKTDVPETKDVAAHDAPESDVKLNKIPSEKPSGKESPNKDDKWPKPVLEIKRLTEREIGELSQASTQEACDLSQASTQEACDVIHETQMDIEPVEQEENEKQLNKVEQPVRREATEANKSVETSEEGPNSKEEASSADVEIPSDVCSPKEKSIPKEDDVHKDEDKSQEDSEKSNAKEKEDQLERSSKKSDSSEDSDAGKKLRKKSISTPLPVLVSAPLTRSAVSHSGSRRKRGIGPPSTDLPSTSKTRRSGSVKDLKKGPKQSTLDFIVLDSSRKDENKVQASAVTKDDDVKASSRAGNKSDAEEKPDVSERESPSKTDAARGDSPSKTDTVSPRSKTKTARKSVNPFPGLPIPEASPTHGRSKRTVKKSLKAKLAEEDAMSSTRRLSPSASPDRKKPATAKRATKRTSSSSDLDEDNIRPLTDEDSILESDASSAPSLSIEQLVTGPILNKLEPEEESMDASTTNEPKDDASLKNIFTPNKSESKSKGSNKSKKRESIKRKSTQPSVSRSRRKSKSTEGSKVDLDKENDKGALPVEENEAVGGDEETKVADDASSVKKPKEVPEENMENDKVEAEQVSTTEEKDVSEKPPVSEESSSDASMTDQKNVVTDKDVNKSSKREKQSASPETSKVSSRKTASQGSVKKRKSGIGSDEHNLLLRPPSKDDDAFKFIAQKNLRTYSRDVGRVQPLQTCSTSSSSSPTSSSKPDISPLVQRMGSRAARMLEAAAKKNLSTYEKMKYEQHRSTDRPETDKKSENADKLPTAFQSPNASFGSPLGGQLSALPTSPSIGILKRSKSIESVSTPSPTNKRRVSFAEPLVQTDDQSKTREPVNRCLKMNQGGSRSEEAPVEDAEPTALPSSPEKKEAAEKSAPMDLEKVSPVKECSEKSSESGPSKNLKTVTEVDDEFNRLRETAKIHREHRVETTIACKNSDDQSFPDEFSKEELSSAVPGYKSTVCKTVDGLLSAVADTDDDNASQEAMEMEVDAAAADVSSAVSADKSVSAEKPVAADETVSVEPCPPAVDETVSVESCPPAVDDAAEPALPSIDAGVFPSGMGVLSDSLVVQVDENEDKTLSESTASEEVIETSEETAVVGGGAAAAAAAPAEQDCEPPVKRRRIELLERADELVEMCTPENITSLPADVIIQLQQRINSLSMAVIRGALLHSSSPSKEVSVDPE